MKKFLQFNKIKSALTTPTAVVVLISTLITFFVGGIVGLGSYLLVGKFWGTFFITLGAQIVIFAIINNFLVRKDTIEGAKIVNEQLETLARFTIRLACAYCKQQNTLPIQLNKENRFKCESCGEVSGVKMQFYSTQITTPVTKVSIPVTDSETIEFKAITG